MPVLRQLTWCRRHRISEIKWLANSRKGNRLAGCPINASSCNLLRLRGPRHAAGAEIDPRPPARFGGVQRRSRIVRWRLPAGGTMTASPRNFIDRVFFGYQNAATLKAALELDVFTAIGNGV